MPPALSTNKTLRLRETAMVRDGGFTWQPASAFLDTGNQHMTIVDTAFAARHGILVPHAEGVFSQVEDWTTLQGVVPGAQKRVPVVTIALQIRGMDFLIRAAVSDMPGSDLLVGIDVLRDLFAAGFTISTFG